MFFSAALDAPKPIGTMPGIQQLPTSSARAQAKAVKERGVGSVILFGLPKTKDDRGTSGLDPDGPVPRAIAEMKSAVPELVVMADVCVDEYTEHVREIVVNAWFVCGCASRYSPVELATSPMVLATELAAQGSSAAVADGNDVMDGNTSAAATAPPAVEAVTTPTKPRRISRGVAFMDNS